MQRMGKMNPHSSACHEPLLCTCVSPAAWRAHTLTCLTISAAAEFPLRFLFVILCRVKSPRPHFLLEKLSQTWARLKLLAVLNQSSFVIKWQISDISFRSWVEHSAQTLLSQSLTRLSCFLSPSSLAEVQFSLQLFHGFVSVSCRMLLLSPFPFPWYVTSCSELSFHSPPSPPHLRLRSLQSSHQKRRVRPRGTRSGVALWNAHFLRR